MAPGVLLIGGNAADSLHTALPAFREALASLRLRPPISAADAEAVFERLAAPSPLITMGPQAANVRQAVTFAALHALLVKAHGPLPRLAPLQGKPAAGTATALTRPELESSAAPVTAATGASLFPRADSAAAGRGDVLPMPLALPLHAEQQQAATPRATVTAGGVRIRLPLSEQRRRRLQETSQSQDQNQPQQSGPQAAPRAAGLAQRGGGGGTGGGAAVPGQVARDDERYGHGVVTESDSGSEHGSSDSECTFVTAEIESRPPNSKAFGSYVISL